MKIIGVVMIVTGIIFLFLIFYPEIIFSRNMMTDVGILILPLSFFTMLSGFLSIIMGIGVICGWYEKKSD